MRTLQTKNTSLSRIQTSSQLVAFLIILFLPLLPTTVVGQELGEPLIGPEILSEAVEIEHNPYAACVLRNTGTVFCWETALSLVNNFDDFFDDTAGYSKLNAALNNDIASITLDRIHLCGIGRVSGIACVISDRPRDSSNPAMQSPPEPDASYLSIADLGNISSAVNCAIQSDNRTVCWGARGSLTESFLDVPPVAAYLKQVEVLSFRACGIDLNDAVVCWGYLNLLENGQDRLFGDVDVATIGPAKQITLGRIGACIIDMNDSLECFGQISSYTDTFAGRSFSSIELNGRVLCYETTSGLKDCATYSYAEDIASSESILSTDTDVRLITPMGTVCYVTTEDEMKCVVSGDLPDQNKFPTAPRNLSVNLYSDTTAEISWERPNQDLTSSEFVTGYEIFRDGVFIDRLHVVSSYIDYDSNPSANYEVRATRALIAGPSSFINADGSIGTGLPMEPSPSTPPTPPATTPTIPTTTGDVVIELTGLVYSSSALELFYNNAQVENPELRYNILRNGVSIRTNSPATSQFETDLDPNTTYLYEVQAVRDGNIISSDNVTLTTFDDGSGSTSATPVSDPVTPNDPASTSGINVMLSGVVYSSTALELFWNRAPIAHVTYNVFRDGVLVRENTPAISHYDGQLPPDNAFQYEVVALLDGDVVASTTIEINPSYGEISEPIASGPQSPTTVPQTSGVAPIELTGAVYSSTALELSWSRDAIPGVTYNIFRNGELIRENSPATSQLQTGLSPNTYYLYTVTPFLNGVEQDSETIKLSTHGI